MNLIDDARELSKYINELLNGDSEKLEKIFNHLCKHGMLIYHASREQLIDIFKDMND